ncbi:MAG TPA: hypothetical protein PKD70_00450 [Saprospiraceae bacterium]|nr:hypothetical protein [Saprospiraceae bacterium]HMP12315.1 hypothetical protein [Saprospiraceae bacterium]
MIRLTVQQLINSIEEVAKDLIAAAGADGMVSRNDIQQLLAQQQQPRRALIEAFYNFLREEDQQYQRVTRRTIQDGLAVVRNQIIGQLEVSPAGLSVAEQQTILQSAGDEALALAVALKQAGRGDTYLTPEAILQTIADNTEALFFDYIGSEGSQPIEAIRIPAAILELTPESFAQALALDPNDPAQVVERFVPATDFFEQFACQHQPFELDKKASAITNVMLQNLTQLTIIVLGRDNDLDVGPLHPAYIVGVAVDGSLIGFRSEVVWT